ncbi:SidG protein, substrate of the Dot/Icm system [Legionella sainthelensi]|uniref:SidG protein, substrate of the Dot/Icm system n=1 Tax=Legionella sainthelensi TaxID=28087 RepID=A0A0W0YQL7_9GAMM|nr:hypothetical protein [Legionella sainthelensi]KTD59108.1 SidG protein, substrate of the Dot/Icm system [Legionella sainthelensi]VEH35975.1 protein SidG [Legionella sainthelensi]
MSISKDEIQLPQDSLYGITIQTWGTQSRPSNGMITFADQKLFGGDVGHASVNMKLPVTATTKEWIEKYCYKQTYEQFKKIKGEESTYEEYLKDGGQVIPVSLKTQTTRAARYDSSGKLVATHDKAYEQTYFDIDWSWWPGRIQTTEEDYVWEREGKHFEYDEKWKAILQPEQRIHKGKLGHRLMDYAPSSIIHQRDIPSSELEKITRNHQIHQIEERIKLVALLNSKIEEMTGPKVTPSMELMFKNLGMNIEQLLNETKDREVDTKNVEKLKEYLTARLFERKSELQQQLQELQNEIDEIGIRTKIEDVFYDLDYQYNNILVDKDKGAKQLKNIDRLLELFAINKAETIPYSAEIGELVSNLPFLENKLQLINGIISPKSIENLIEHIETLKNDLSKQLNKKNEQATDLINKYDKLLEQYQNDEEGLENVLWEEGIEKEDVEKARKTISQSETSPELAKLVSLQEQLSEHKENGVLLSSELESSLNACVKQWKSQLDTACQVITKESMAEIKEALEQQRIHIETEIQLLKEKESNVSVERHKAEQEMIKVKEFTEFYSKNASAYLVIGLPPSHDVKLPLAVNGKRGLNPLAMLQKMRELASPEAKGFDLQTNNCSLTSIEVLAAGAAHDPLLHSIMNERALGFFGTPQQVLENVQLARATISENKHSNFLTSLINGKPLDRAMGYAMGIYMDPQASKTKQNAGLALAALVGIAKLPGIILSTLVNPKDKFNDLIHNINLVYERNSTGLKVGFTLLAAPILLILAPLAAIQKGIEIIGSAIAKPFKLVANLFKQKLTSTDEITVPVGDASENQENYSNTKLAERLNKKIKSKIDENTITIEYHKSPEKLIIDFELKLKENPEKVVVLSEKAHNSVIKFIATCKDEELKNRFFDSCNQSLNRSNKFAPKTKDEITEMVKEVTPVSEQRISENRNSFIGQLSNSNRRNMEIPTVQVLDNVDEVQSSIRGN